MHLSELHLNSDSWESRANKVLSHFKYNHPDEIDLYDICWRYGVTIKPLDSQYIQDIDYDSISHLKAFSIPKSKGRRGTIYLRPDLDAVEKKLLLAEEFCHVHSHYTSQLSTDPCGLAKIENQARRMAAYLLMPSKFLLTVINMAVDQPVLISEIADYFVVTEEFAQFRLKLAYNRRIDALINHKGRLGGLEWWE
ncbi:ImmA/IrrE family metallo-endopeptidase [Peribacillus asahii]|uniref:ImmA/IrrE family metallo-endopeptidase n=1 Tax=Peribacillus asahii TaxID=228899 RepID=UPI00207A51C7|nr:ImmA/IrrE family metallo-endopeptidase [Peribacillus asahii]USK71728.1 ImmA/IrrE family metallo-endopeptidase [Peribacillus asahii]